MKTCAPKFRWLLALTLLAALMGLLPSKGESRYEGQDLRVLITEERVRRGICLVPERRELFTKMTVADNLVLGAYTRWRDRQLDDAYAHNRPAV